ncbi:MAG: hypothetical protein IPN88_19320 [Bacteroidetes bacterium]|nr:hypothetical protein [Bacteroidota bacterium]
MSTAFPGGSIRYTTDGSDKRKFNVICWSNFNFYYKDNSGRVFAANAIGSSTVTHTYFINLTCRFANCCTFLQILQTYMITTPVFFC